MRMCPAQSQVLTQMAYLLVRWAQEFRVIRDGNEVLEYVEEIRMTVESRKWCQDLLNTRLACNLWAHCKINVSRSSTRHAVRYW